MQTDLPIPPQPSDPNDPLYRVIDGLLVSGDQERIKIKLNVSDAAVSQVKNGVTKSKRIWAALMEIVIQRKSERDQVLKYLQS